MLMLISISDGNFTTVIDKVVTLCSEQTQYTITESIKLVVIPELLRSAINMLILEVPATQQRSR